MNKKSMYFTLLTIVMLSIFVFSFGTHVYQRYSQQVLVAEYRINALNDFAKSVERDIERGLYISSFRALLSLENYIASTGEFLDDFNASFYSAIINGTIENQSSFLMIDTKFPDWVTGVVSKGDEMNIDVNISIHNVEVYQNSPWFVTVRANLSVNVTDNSGIASFSREPVIETNINITGFEDPLYIVNLAGKSTNAINQTTFDGDFTSGDDVSNLLVHLNNSLYVNNTMAPSFLMRFENNLDYSPHGIESFVNVKKLSDLDLGYLIKQKSCVDHVYWASGAVTDYQINYTPSWFRVDEEHLDRYGIRYLKAD